MRNPSIEKGGNFASIEETTISSAVVIENDARHRVHVVAARRPLRSRNAKGGRARNVVAQDYTHARYIAAERRARGERKRHKERKKGRRGRGKKREEEVGRHARGAARLVEYVLPRGVGIIAPVGRGRSRKWDRLFRVGGNGR